MQSTRLIFHVPFSLQQNRLALFSSAPSSRGRPHALTFASFASQRVVMVARRAIAADQAEFLLLLRSWIWRAFLSQVAPNSAIRTVVAVDAITRSHFVTACKHQTILIKPKDKFNQNPGSQLLENHQPTTFHDHDKLKLTHSGLVVIHEHGDQLLSNVTEISKSNAENKGNNNKAMRKNGSPNPKRSLNYRRG